MSNRMILALPDYLRTSEVFQGIMNAEYSEVQAFETVLADVKAQVNIDTATWALPLYENELAIPIDNAKTYQERRSLVKSKWRGSGIVTAELIKSVADAYANGNVQIDFDPANGIVITFVAIAGVPSNVNDLKADLRNTVPAHLILTFIYNYLIWSEYDATGFTWNQWDALGLNWVQFEEYK